MEETDAKSQPVDGEEQNKRKLFIGNLSWDVKNENLSEFFAAVGSVESAEVIVERDSGRSKGFGFVLMATEEEAEKAVKELNGKELMGRPVVVNVARPKVRRDDR